MPTAWNGCFNKPERSFSRRGRYLRWNENLETMLGYSHEELLGCDSLDLVPDEDKEKIRKARDNPSFS